MNQLLLVYNMTHKIIFNTLTNQNYVVIMNDKNNINMFDFSSIFNISNNVIRLK